MMTLKDPHPPKRPTSILALDWIAAPPSDVIAVGTVAARVQAWNDVINKSPLCSHGPSPPSKKRIKTRDGSDRGVRSSFGRRAEGSFGKPAVRSDRLAPEGIKNDGLPPVGGPHRASEGIGGLPSGGADIEEHRLAGIVREMTFYDRSADRRALGRSLDSMDDFDHGGCVAHDKQRGVIENRKRRTSNKHSLGIAMSADHNLSHANESSPKSVIDELGEMIDEALAHHRMNSAEDCTTAKQIEKALAKHACRSSKYYSHTGETVNARKRHLPKEDWQHMSLDERNFSSKHHSHAHETDNLGKGRSQGETWRQRSPGGHDRSSKHQSSETINQRKQRSLIEQWQQRSQEEQDVFFKYQSRRDEASNQREDQSQGNAWQHRSRDHYLSPKHGSQSNEPIDPRDQHSLSDESQKRSRNGHDDPGMKRRSADNFSQTPLIARMAAEELAINEPSILLNDGMIRSANGSSSSSPPSRDHPSGQALIRRYSKRRRSSTMFRKPPATHDYPMSDLHWQRPRRLTIDSGTLANHHEGEEVGHGETLTTISSPGMMSTVSTRRTSNDKKPSRRHPATFLSSAANDKPTKGPAEPDFATWNRGRDQSSQGTETTMVEESLSRGEQGQLSATKGGPQQHTLSDIAGSEDQAQFTTDVPASTVTETPASTRRESPKPSVSSATSQKTQSPIAWPFRWRLALVDKGESINSGRSEVSAVGSHESADPTTWRSRRTGSGSNGARPSLSSDVPGDYHDAFGRALKRSQSDPRLSQSEMNALRSDFIECRSGQEEPRVPLTRSRSASVTPKNRLSRSTTINRRPAHVKNRAIGDQSGAHQEEDESIHIFSRRPSQTTRYTEGTRERTYSADDESAAPVFVLTDDDSVTPTPILTIEESATSVSISTNEQGTTPVSLSTDEEGITPVPISADESTIPVLVPIKDETTIAGPASPKEDVSSPVPASPSDDTNSPGLVSPNEEATPLIPVLINDESVAPNVYRPRASWSNSAINEDGSRTRRMSEVAAVERSSRRTNHHHHTLSGHNRGEQSGSTIGSSKTFRTGGRSGLRDITIKVEIRTRDEQSETAEEQREDTLVVKAKIGKREVSHHEVSTESGSGE